MVLPPPRSPLFPYTTLFRSVAGVVRHQRRDADAEVDVVAVLEFLRRARGHLVLGPGHVGTPSGLTRGALLDALFGGDRKSTRLNSSHVSISYAVFCLKKKIQ